MRDWPGGRETLLHLLSAAQTAVRRLGAAQKAPQTSVPDATAVMILYRDGELTCAHLGDSRLYYVDEHAARALTVDHSVAAMMHSTLPPREDPDRARLVRTILSTPRDEDIGPSSIRVAAGQAFLLCSDGLWQAVSDERIRATYLGARSPQEWTESLRREVLAAADAEQDNFTALAVWPQVRAESQSRRWWSLFE
jgi:serine/threonine protein phosphatase PrpC